MAHLLIAAAHKSSGKTSVTTGLAAALSRRGLAVQCFKKGPDYIDPLWLGAASGRACWNLDFYTQSEDEIRATFARHSAPADISLIEANKGLHDGLDVEGSDSSAALAKLLGAPVVLVIDAQGIMRGVAPLVRGYLDFDKDVNICGIILNKVGGARHEAKLRAALERYTDLSVLGAVGREAGLEIPERHLGLLPANEAPEAEAMIARLADAVEKNLDLDKLLEIARKATPSKAPAKSNTVRTTDLRIAVARDAAFGFYYADDLEAFAAAGAEVVFFDTLADSRLPEADGLFIGGGFPETQMAALEANARLREDIRVKLAAGMPAYAECGGLMYLARSIAWQGENREMVGVIPADIAVGGKPQGRGYMLLEESGEGLWPPTEGAVPQLPAHEFHYAAFENLPGGQRFAYAVKRGQGIDGQHDGLVIGNLLATFAHQRNTASNPWVGRFVEFVRSCAD